MVATLVSIHKERIRLSLLGRDFYHDQHGGHVRTLAEAVSEQDLERDRVHSSPSAVLCNAKAASFFPVEAPKEVEIESI